MNKKPRRIEEIKSTAEQHAPKFEARDIDVVLSSDLLDVLADSDVGDAIALAAEFKIEADSGIVGVLVRDPEHPEDLKRAYFSTSSQDFGTRISKQRVRVVEAVDESAGHEASPRAAELIERMGKTLVPTLVEIPPRTPVSGDLELTEEGALVEEDEHDVQQEASPEMIAELIDVAQAAIEDFYEQQDSTIAELEAAGRELLDGAQQDLWRLVSELDVRTQSMIAAQRYGSGIDRDLLRRMASEVSEFSYAITHKVADYMHGAGVIRTTSTHLEQDTHRSLDGVGEDLKSVAGSSGGDQARIKEVARIIDEVAGITRNVNYQRELSDHILDASEDFDRRIRMVHAQSVELMNAASRQGNEQILLSEVEDHLQSIKGVINSFRNGIVATGQKLPGSIDGIKRE